VSARVRVLGEGVVLLVGLEAMSSEGEGEVVGHPEQLPKGHALTRHSGAAARCQALCSMLDRLLVVCRHLQQCGGQGARKSAHSDGSQQRDGTAADRAKVQTGFGDGPKCSRSPSAKSCAVAGSSPMYSGTGK
jgi:hypothetical protein